MLSSLIARLSVPTHNPFENFDRLTQSRLPEAAFLISCAKTISPELNVEQEMKRVRDRWKVSVEELRIKQ